MDIVTKWLLGTCLPIHKMAAMEYITRYLLVGWLIKCTKYSFIRTLSAISTSYPSNTMYLPYLFFRVDNTLPKRDWVPITHIFSKIFMEPRSFWI